MMAHRSSVEVEYDVNLLRVSPPLSSSDDHLRVEYADWRGNGATSAVDEREFYHFLSDDGTAVAWYSLVRSEEVAGVFDVGVREDRRGLGIGTAMMGSIGSRTPLVRANVVVKSVRTGLLFSGRICAVGVRCSRSPVEDRAWQLSRLFGPERGVSVDPGAGVSAG